MVLSLTPNQDSEAVNLNSKKKTVVLSLTPNQDSEALNPNPKKGPKFDSHPSQYIP